MNYTPNFEIAPSLSGQVSSAVGHPHICSNEGCAYGRPLLWTPDHVFSGDKVLDEYRHRDYPGFYVSPCGYVYCCRKCWASYCDD